MGKDDLRVRCYSDVDELNACVGLYAAGTHDVVPIPDCAAHDPAVNAAAHRVPLPPPAIVSVDSTLGGDDDVRFLVTVERLDAETVQQFYELECDCGDCSEGDDADDDGDDGDPFGSDYDKYG